MTDLVSKSKNIWKLGTKFVRPHNKGSTERDERKNYRGLLKIYGERNSGTHFVQRLIRQNFRCQSIPGTLAEACPGYREAFEEQLKQTVSDEAKLLWMRQAKMDAYFQGNIWGTLGWKHSVPPINTILGRPDMDNILFVTVTKNPYAWILSLFRRPYDNLGINHPEQLRDFVNEPWPTVSRDNARAILKSPVELWNVKTSAYSELGKVARVVRVRYEDVIDDPLKCLTRIADYLEQKGNQISIDTDSAKASDRGKKDLNYYRDYYLNEQWRRELGAEEVALINQFLDPAVVEAAGYQWLDSG